MAATLTKQTVSRDQRGYTVTEQTLESFSEMTPDTNARTWAQTIDDGKYTLVQTFTDEIPNPDPGGGGPPTVFPETWSCEVATSAEPIESHPRFSVFTDAQWAKYRLWRNGQPNPSTWTPSTQMGSLGVYLERYIGKNITSYLAPRITIKHTYSATTKPNLGLIGRINFPDFATNMTPSGVNFIVTGASVVQEGPLYKISYEWLGSSLGGWDTFIYYAS
jgi:hypothetical protein